MSAVEKLLVVMKDNRELKWRYQRKASAKDNVRNSRCSLLVGKIVNDGEE